jgi:DNA (cytosine-5)-methyltransferase 1
MINGISLFSNIGIGECYLSNCGINIVTANELEKDRAETYSFYHPNAEMVQGDILDPKVFNRLVELYKQYDCKFAICTPPCQGMSINNCKLHGSNETFDERNNLILPIINFIKETLPENILIENVPNVIKFSIIVDNKEIGIKEYIEKELTPLGYTVNNYVVNAADYGTPQSRRRGIFLISKIGTWVLPSKQSRISIHDAISDLPSIEPGEDSGILHHFAKEQKQEYIDWLKHTPTGCSALNNEPPYQANNKGEPMKTFDTCYSRMSWDKPSPTIVTKNNAYSNNNLHPGRKLPDGTYSDARPITFLELLRISGCPDDFKVPNNISLARLRFLFGEQFPPKLVQALISVMPPNSKQQTLI